MIETRTSVVAKIIVCALLIIMGIATIWKGINSFDGLLTYISSICFGGFLLFIGVILAFDLDKLR